MFVGFDVAVSWPSSLRATTCERIRKPASACRSEYDALLAFEIRSQSDASAAPAPSHRNHRYSYWIGVVPVHWPLVVRRTCPTRVVPVTRGLGHVARRDGRRRDGLRRQQPCEDGPYYSDDGGSSEDREIRAPEAAHVVRNVIACSFVDFPLGAVNTRGRCGRKAVASTRLRKAYDVPRRPPARRHDVAALRTEAWSGRRESAPCEVRRPGRPVAR